MSGRDRVLAALDGQEPDRIPLALSFYHVDGAALASPGAWRADLVDVGFVAFPVSAEEEELQRTAAPYAGNARIGSSSQVARDRRPFGAHGTGSLDRRRRRTREPVAVTASGRASRPVRSLEPRPSQRPGDR